MKEICQCNCTLIGRYRTPWCDLLHSLHGTSGEVLHLWYKLDWLRQEVDKRSAYLGKFRRTEEAQHLLDLINMTVDEDDLFVPFAKAAMADVYDELMNYSPKHEMAYFWNEGKYTIVFDDPESESDASDDDEPVTFVKGDYVLYNGNLYIAIADGSSEDFIGKLYPTEDYRKSIHYGILWRCCGSNINIVDPLDTAIFEALVARIIYKWLLYAYPAEAPRYLDEWNECLEKIKRRASALNGSKIVHRIPRP